jgi:hypothetical protein
MKIKISQKEKIKFLLFYVVSLAIAIFAYFYIEGLAFDEITTPKGIKLVLFSSIGALFPVFISYYFLNVRIY